MKTNYDGQSDEQLIVKFHDAGDKESGIMDFIMDKYKNLVRKKAVSMFILGADRDDLIQEGMIGLFKAIRDYDIGRVLPRLRICASQGRCILQSRHLRARNMRL